MLSGVPGTGSGTEPLPFRERCRVCVSLFTEATQQLSHRCPPPAGEQPAAERDEVILLGQGSVGGVEELDPRLGGGSYCALPATRALWRVQGKSTVRQREAQGKRFVCIFPVRACRPALAVAFYHSQRY